MDFNSKNTIFLNKNISNASNYLSSARVATEEIILSEEQSRVFSIGFDQQKVTFIILAAGKASRFGGRSKVLQDLCGKRVLDLVIEIAGDDEVVLVGNEIVVKTYEPKKRVVFQEKATGNGDAFLLGLCAVEGKGPIVVLMGDSPLILREDINKALKLLANNEVVIGKFKGVKDGYGRIVEYSNTCRVYDELEMPENVFAKFSNAGWICFRRDFVEKIKRLPVLCLLEKPDEENKITKYVNMSNSSCAIEVSESSSIGINSFEDYRAAYLEVQKRLASELFTKGVDFISGYCEGLRFDSRIGAGTLVYQNVVFGPKVTIGKNCTILPFCYLENCEIGDDCTIGPFCHIRGGSIVGRGCHIGSFCEVNRSEVGIGCKAKHFSYLGDAQLEENVNVGAGTIFCNYDGREKHQTKVRKNAFLGSGSLYIAPVEVAENAFVGAGTLVAKDVGEFVTCIDKRQRVDYCRIKSKKDKK